MKVPEWLPAYGDFKYRGKCPRESAEQITFFNQLRGQYPDSYGRIAIHPRNEGQLVGGQHSGLDKQKAEGMSVGASDIVIVGAPAFVCELKRRDHTQCTWQPGQIEYLEAAKNSGAFVCVALGWEAAWEAFNDWMEIKERK